MHLGQQNSGKHVWQDWHKETAVAQSVNWKNAKKRHYISVLGLNFVVKAVLYAVNETFIKKSKAKHRWFSRSKNDAKWYFVSIFALQLKTFCRNHSLFLHHWLYKRKETIKLCFKTEIETWFSCLRKIWFFNWVPYFTSPPGICVSQRVNDTNHFLNILQSLNNLPANSCYT